MHDVYLFVLAEDKVWDPSWKSLLETKKGHGQNIHVCNFSLFIMNKTVYWMGKV